VAYYQGDYYQGDYYQGDPFFGGLIATGASWLAKKIFKRKLTSVGTTELARRTSTGLKRAALWGGGAAVATGMQIPIPFSPFQMTPSAILPGGVPFIGPRAASQTLRGGGRRLHGPTGGLLPQRVPPGEGPIRPLCSEPLDERREPAGTASVPAPGGGVRQIGPTVEEGHPTRREGHRCITAPATSAGVSGKRTIARTTRFLMPTSSA